MSKAAQDEVFNFYYDHPDPLDRIRAIYSRIVDNGGTFFASKEKR